MLVNISYTEGRCPLCGGPAGCITTLDNVKDFKIPNMNLSYSNYITFQAKCDTCSTIWYVKCFSYVGDDKAGIGTRRAYIATRDYATYKNLLEDMVDKEANLLLERMGQYEQRGGETKGETT